jgi:hypothetical protein
MDYVIGFVDGDDLTEFCFGCGVVFLLVQGESFLVVVIGGDGFPTEVDEEEKDYGDGGDGDDLGHKIFLTQSFAKGSAEERREKLAGDFFFRQTSEERRKKRGREENYFIPPAPLLLKLGLRGEIPDTQGRIVSR